VRQGDLWDLLQCRSYQDFHTIDLHIELRTADGVGEEEEEEGEEWRGVWGFVQTHAEQAGQSRPHQTLDAHTLSSKHRGTNHATHTKTVMAGSVKPVCKKAQSKP
jgi:hypothetical protein